MRLFSFRVPEHRYSQQQFLVSTYTSLAIPGIIIIVAGIVIFSRFREPCLPRRPDTLGAVMSYLSGS